MIVCAVPRLLAIVIVPYVQAVPPRLPQVVPPTTAFGNTSGSGVAVSPDTPVPRSPTVSTRPLAKLMVPVPFVVVAAVGVKPNSNVHDP